MGAWVLTSLALLGSCSDDKNKENLGITASVSYVQTYCADPWGQARSSQDLVSAATAYLSQRNITLYQAQATQDNAPSLCLACSCTSGLVLHGLVRDQDVAAVQALGFTVD
ncbi:hypothetical protein B0919_15160 [Hymenobacter sp. CRA2]|nr:hypothetical protein B0919_15160 [Hymenobacter sp. CRA2]